MKEKAQDDHLIQAPSSLQKAGKSEKDPNPHEKHSEGLPGIYQHIFFAFVVLLGVVYFSSFLDLMKPTNQRTNPESHSYSKGDRY